MIVLRRPLRWGCFALLAHCGFLVMVCVVDFVGTQWTLRGLQEHFVDRPAFDLWWRLLNAFPRQIGEIMYPVDKAIGRGPSNLLFWAIWYISVGGVLYFLLGFTLGWLRELWTRR